MSIIFALLIFVHYTNLALQHYVIGEHHRFINEIYEMFCEQLTHGTACQLGIHEF